MYRLSRIEEKFKYIGNVECIELLNSTENCVH